MKKTLLILSITLLATFAFAFPAGTLNIGGTTGFDSYKANSDAKLSNTFYLNSNIGYLFMDNISADVLLGLTANRYDKDTVNLFYLGLGARYFMDMGDNKAYAGLGATFDSYSSKTGALKYSDSGTYLNAKLGYLLPLTPEVFLDLAAKYEKGVIEYKDSTFGVSLGLQFFAPFFVR